MRYTLTTTKGDILIELNEEKAPISAKNFAKYADVGHYDGTIFHRVIDGFMIQGGAFEPDMNQRQGTDPIKNEWQNGLSNTRGTLAMARLGNQPDSATNQFFINVVDNERLNGSAFSPGYAVFGKVVKGMETVDKIRNVATTTKGQYANCPVDPVIIESAKKLTDDQVSKLDLD